MKKHLLLFVLALIFSACSVNPQQVASLATETKPPVSTNTAFPTVTPSQTPSPTLTVTSTNIPRDVWATRTAVFATQEADSEWIINFMESWGIMPDEYTIVDGQAFDSEGKLIYKEGKLLLDTAISGAGRNCEATRFVKSSGGNVFFGKTPEDKAAFNSYITSIIDKAGEKWGRQFPRSTWIPTYLNAEKHCWALTFWKNKNGVSPDDLIYWNSEQELQIIPVFDSSEKKQ